MNALEILEHGDQMLREAMSGLPEADWWPVREVIAHVTAHEMLLAEFLESYLGERPVAAGTPLNGQVNGDGGTSHADRSVDELWAEYEAAHTRCRTLLARIERESSRINGTASYGPGGDLEDFLVYSYGHKQRHAAQIAVYRDQLARMAALSI
ncbi:MAG: DinB family protein [Candidatus Promineifilaceae bacterium]|nr:DinB family protein [Candidatus Promineifilaceae bacterium]